MEQPAVTSPEPAHLSKPSPAKPFGLPCLGSEGSSLPHPSTSPVVSGLLHSATTNPRDTRGLDRLGLCVGTVAQAPAKPYPSRNKTRSPVRNSTGGYRQYGQSEGPACVSPNR